MQTVAAISTPNACGGIGVIRISGDDAIAIAERVFISARGKAVSEMSGYTCAYGMIHDTQGEPIDDVVLTVFRKPHSYTGEDVVEISCHGGIYICRKIMTLLFSVGASPAAAGEFTKRAFLNGKLDLSQAEAVMNAIMAEGEFALREANLARDGHLSAQMRECRGRLTAMISAMSYWMDDPEETPPELESGHLSNEINEMITVLGTLSSRYDQGRVYREGIRTALVGAPNAGKSSIMNWLAGMQRSIVTDIPGTTRDVITESVRVGDFVLLLSDTAGLRQTGDVIEAMGVDAAFEQARQADLILHIVDSTTTLRAEERQWITDLRHPHIITIYNKIDLCKDAVPELEPNAVVCSAKLQSGYDDIVRAIQDMFGMDHFANTPSLVSQRQKQLVDEAVNLLTQAANDVLSGMPLDVICMQLELAANTLAAFDGEIVTDDIIDGVFSKFCVGK